MFDDFLEKGRNDCSGFDITVEAIDHYFQDKINRLSRSNTFLGLVMGTDLEKLSLISNGARIKSIRILPYQA